MTPPKKKTIAIIGATGVVGRTILTVLEERNFPAGTVIPVASDRSAGTSVACLGAEWPVVDLDRVDWGEIDFCFFTAGREISARTIPLALKRGCKIIDNTTAYRMDDRIPLVIPEINGALITGATRLVASPNCTASIMVMALAPLHRAAGLRRVTATSMQSVSGTGRAAVDEMMAQLRADLAGVTVPPAVYPKQIAFNCLPQVGEIAEDGFSGEEEKVAAETRKILSAPDLKIAATTVRVPVRIGHAVSVAVEVGTPMTVEDVRRHFEEAPGVGIGDTIPTPLDAAGGDSVLVGRIRADDTAANGFLFWVVGDNLRKGAATNCVQIAERMLHAGSG